MRIIFTFMAAVLLVTASCDTQKNTEREYSVFNSYEEIINAPDSTKYPEAKLITHTGTKENPLYHGFFFYNCAPLDCSQFNPSGNLMVGMRIYIEGRDVEPSDRGDIGIIDVENNYKWTTIGSTTAWNWQQGCRAQWVPGSKEEIIWNDRSDEGERFVSRIYNIRTKKTRTLPRSFYAISPDGKTALTHDYQRMKHGGTNFVGIEDKYDDQWAPDKTGIWKMDMKTGKSEMIISVARIVPYMYTEGIPTDTTQRHLYFFRQGWNPSGGRFIAFVKDAGTGRTITKGFSMTPEGKDIRPLYSEPSHHYWINDSTILDWGSHIPPGSDERVRGYYLFEDDGSNKPKKMLWAAGSNGHDSFHPNGEWIITDTYNLHGYQYLYMYHIPTKKFVALGKFEFRLGGKQCRKNAGSFRVDLHPRISPDGMYISFDSTHDKGRQIYIMDISHIINNPPEF